MLFSDHHQILKDLEELFNVQFIGHFEDEFCEAKYLGGRPLNGFPITGETKLSFNLKEFKDAVEKLNIVRKVDDLIIYSSSTFEVVALQENPRRLIYRKKLALSDNDLEYSYGRISFLYLIFLLSTIAKAEINSLFRMFRAPLEEEYELENGTYNLNKIMCHCLRLYSIKIESANSIFNENNIHQYETSFRFSLAYNLDQALLPQRFLEEIVGSNRIRRMRQNDITELDVPRKFYNEDLVNHYILAISSDNIVIQYLSYYHVIEHFFNKISDEKITQDIRALITSEDFSYKKDKDIMRAVKKVKKFYQSRIDNDLTYNEAQSLKLCLDKYIDIQSDIVDKLESYHAELIDVYKNEIVPFSQGPKVNFRNEDRANVITTLAERIYSTRNSLVHSKDGEKKKYEPFKDDKYLLKEIPLMRFIAESIISKESQVM